MLTARIQHLWEALWPRRHGTEPMKSLSEAGYATRSAEIKECLALLRATVQALDIKRTPEASKRWKILTQVAAANDLSLATLLGPNSANISFLEELLERQEWSAVRFFWSRIEDGTYAQGRLKRTFQGLFTMKEGRNDGLSLYFPSTGGMYCGEMRDGMMQGFGQMRYPLGDVFEGHWAQGRWHGSGTFRALGQKGNAISGQFIGGKLQSDLEATISGEARP